MFSKRGAAVSPPLVQSETNNLKVIYQKFTSFIGRVSDTNTTLNSNNTTNVEMLSARGSVAPSEDSFLTPVASVEDLVTMSPPHAHHSPADTTSDLLTGTEFDSICDVTMHEVPTYDEMFIDATSLDYLVKCSEANRNHTQVDRGKESLFVKFDPLYAKKSNTDSLADSTECDVGYETGGSATVLPDIPIGSDKLSISCDSINVNFRERPKPMQVVPPVVNGMPRAVNHVRSTPMLVRSVSAILTPTQVATERLVNIGTTPPTAAPRSPRQVSSHSNVDRLQSLRIILQKQDQEIMQLTRENRELRANLQDSDYQHKDKIQELESKIKKLTDERDNLVDRESKIVQQLNDKIMSNKQMSIVMEEYEKTISTLIGEQQRDKIHYQELEERLGAERDEAHAHLASMESSFNDLLMKYEKCKAVILESKTREKTYENKIAEYEKGLKKYEKLYNDLKVATTESLNKANETLDTTKKNYDFEIMKLNATIKKNEITISSLQESLAQKTRDNEELSRICDTLINQVR